MEDKLKSLELKYKFLQDQIAMLQAQKAELLNEIITIALKGQADE